MHMSRQYTHITHYDCKPENHLGSVFITYVMGYRYPELNKELESVKLRMIHHLYQLVEGNL